VFTPTAEPRRGEEEEEEEGGARVNKADVHAGFDSLTIWGHESVPDGEHAVIRALEEWVGFAGRVHAF
jgi:ribonuclease H2 subunit C